MEEEKEDNDDDDNDLNEEARLYFNEFFLYKTLQLFWVIA
jgi:hypothetical protein